MPTRLKAPTRWQLMQLQVQGNSASQPVRRMQALLNLARGGRTVISVIHQPRSSIFHMFDQLCLLSEGRVMYIGDAHMAHDYFAGLGFPCPPQFNAADFFLDLVSMDYRMPEVSPVLAHPVLCYPFVLSMYWLKNYVRPLPIRERLLGHG